jgi:glycosyltransferase involved in cell wall biosynthesis
MSAGRRKLVLIAPSPESLDLLRGQAGFMHDHGFDVTLLSHPGPDLEAISRFEPVRVRALPGSGGALASFARLVRFFLGNRPDLVHAYGGAGGALGLAAAWVAGVQGRVFTIEGAAGQRSGGFGRAWGRIPWRAAIGLGRRAYAASESLRKQAEHLGLAPPGKLEVLGAGSVGGVEAQNRFRPMPKCSYEAARARRAVGLPSEARVIGYLGPVARSSGLDDLLGAWGHIRNEFSDVRLFVVGSVDPRDRISPESDVMLRTDPRICRAGDVHARRGVYSAMDIVAIPQRGAGFPQTALEAAAMERPVVATEVAGCVDAVRDGETGMMVRPHDPRFLARAFRAYLRDPELRRNHGKAGRVRMLRDFHPQRLYSLLQGVYLDVLGETGSKVAQVSGPGALARASGEPELTPREESSPNTELLGRAGATSEDAPAAPRGSFVDSIRAWIHWCIAGENAPP